MDTGEPKRILVPTDFSPCSRVALDYAAMLARRFGASVHVLYVSTIPKELVGDALGLGDKFDDADLREGRQQMATVVVELRRQHVEACTGEVVTGFAPKVICQRTASGQYDLLVIGTHGRSGFNRLWLGSVTERVVRHTPIPVMVVRPPAGTADE